MRTITTLAASAASALGLIGAATAAPLTVVIDGVEDRGGTLYVSVQTEAEYMQPTGTEGSMIEAPAPGTLVERYEVEPGDYAVTVWHDDDGDGQFSRADTGMPLDGWALSGEVGGGVPSFEDAKVTVGAGGASTTVRMTYGR